MMTVAEIAVWERKMREAVRCAMIEAGIVRSDELLIGPPTPEAYIDAIRREAD